MYLLDLMITGHCTIAHSDLGKNHGSCYYGFFFFVAERKISDLHDVFGQSDRIGSTSGFSKTPNVEIMFRWLMLNMRRDNRFVIFSRFSEILQRG
jgi:hypothetical protein